MRHLGAVVEIAALPMFHMRQDLAFRRGVALELVGDDDLWGILQALQQLAKEALGCFGIAPALYRDVEHVAVLVHGTPEIVLLATDAQKHLIHEPFVARPWPTPLQRVGKQPTEAQTPIADALVADHDATGSEDGLDLAQAEAEAVIQPHRVLDDLGWKA